MNQPLLSIGMIVKNEERCLEKCLKALEPLRQAIPCELVIADTGSIDRTKEIASKYADILFDFEWINDFSAARNAVMDKCSGKWYLTVDADEYLSSPVDEIVSFLTGPLEKKYIHASIIQRNFSKTDMSGEFSDFNALRMVRMDTGKRYVGTIHESFPNIEILLTYILRDTIFDHDGYTPLSPKHLKEKSIRNLELLENELKDDPTNIRRILQCLESSGSNVEKRRYYANLAKETLKKAPENDPNIPLCGAPCAKEALRLMIADKHPDTHDFIIWSLNRFPDSYHILLDVHYAYVKHLYSEDNYEDCITYCQNYLNSFEKYQERDKTPTFADFGSPIIYVQQKHKLEIQTLLANALINNDNDNKAIEYLTNLDLSKNDKTIITNWFSAILTEGKSDILSKTAGTVIEKLLNKYHSNELKSNDSYDIAILTISKPFSCNPNREQDYNVFKLVPGTIGLSVSIANSETKEEIQNYLNQIEIWEEFMPLALGKTIELGAILPKEFYFMNSTRLTYLTQDLIQGITTYINPLLINYCVVNEATNLYKITFAFNLLSSILVSEEFTKLSEEEKSKTIITFINVSKNYLTRCYNKELLENEEYVFCIPTLHLLSWYLIKANNLKDSNPLEYVRTLRTALKKIPQAKQVIEFLIEEFKNEEELKRHEKIKNTSPELIAMAEQLKTMLKAFPENSPELLAIKQSHIYKQVEFLIED